MKLDKNGDKYYTSKKVCFRPSLVNAEIIDLSFEFAYEMAFGSGHHRKHRTGGQELRAPVEIFRNTFQGKMAEGIFYNYLIENNIHCDKVDYSIHGKGVWDDTDIVYKEKKISIKSAAFFSDLLLLESQDWDSEGRYLPNLENKERTYVYDYFVLIRIKPNTNSLFKGAISKQDLRHEIDSNTWYYDIPGCCSNLTLKFIINNNYTLPKNSFLNGSTRMDAENYYIQCVDLKNITQLINILKKLKCFF
jgi:hypothetical protein